jgi:hypothetical protein
MNDQNKTPDSVQHSGLAGVAGSAALSPLPEVNPDLTGHTYAIALLRDSITYHKTNERTDPECSWARIFELRSAIKLLSSPNAPDQRTRASAQI